MLYEAIIKIVLILFHARHLLSHLKDMGEVTRNWSDVLINLEKRIVGGSKATKNQYPFSVQFFNSGGLCGGSILTKKIVLTAAHCFDHNRNLIEMKIFSNPRFAYDLQATAHDVWDFMIHEKYGENRVFANDIAVLIIHDEFNFGPEVQKIFIINTDVWMNVNETFVATGWGEYKYGGSIHQNRLKAANMYYVSKERCMNENKIDLGPEMFCLHGNGESDTCRGDSGGGVLWKGGLVGIVSHGRGCLETPGIYISVYYNRRWIKKTVTKIYQKFCDFHHNKIMI
nr:trypsin delta-like [Vanessa tameamea]